MVFCSLFGYFPLSATTYYVDATFGSDNNDGLSPTTAWQTLNKIRNSSPEPGDTYLLKSGERWNSESQFYIDYSGTAGAPISFGAYDIGPKPIINGILSVLGAEESQNWVETSPGTWRMALVNTPGRLFLDGEEVLRSSTLLSLGLPDNLGVVGNWFFDNGTLNSSTDNYLYLRATQNPALFYNSIEGSRLFNPALVESADYLNFAGLDFQGGSGASLSIRAGNHINITNCAFGKSAGSGLAILNAATQTANLPSTYVEVSQCQFDSGFTFFYGNGSERGCGDGVQLFYGAQHCKVHDNTFLNWAHNGIELLANAFGAPGVEYNEIHDNTISAPDIPYAHPFGADGFLGKCQFNRFYRNEAYECRTSIQVNGNDNRVDHNLIYRMRRSPSKTQATAHGFSVGIYGNFLVSQNNTFDHNIIYDTDEAAFLLRGYDLPGQAFGHQVRNNIFFNTGLDPYNNQYPAGTGLIIYDTNTDGLGGNTFLNNLIFSTTEVAGPVYIQDDLSNISIDSFNNLNGWDGNTILANISLDPMLSDPDNADFFPLATSPVINSGMNTGLSLDFALMSRNQLGAPDIGPYETPFVLPVVWENFSARLAATTEVLLQWSTVNEVNASHYSLERLNRNGNWQPIYETAASGQDGNGSRYTYTDKQPQIGDNTYRIRQVDIDGQFSFSPIRSVRVPNRQQYHLLRSQPDWLTIVADGNAPMPTKIQLFDVQGRSLRQIEASTAIDISALPRGIYLLVVEAGDSLEAIRFFR